VISSDIGGMAEKVSDGINGLHFRARDAVSLAATLRKAVTTRGLWEELHAGIPQCHTMDAHVETLTQIYDELLEQREVA
jgi:glycosyltransferase involved in cell wall biosynthesis